MRTFRFVTTPFVALVFAAGAIAGGAADDAKAASEPVEADAFVPPPEYPEGWYARIETALGRIVAMLHPEQAPQAVAHFAGLASGSLEWVDPASGTARKTPYYDGIEVHYARSAHLFEVGYRPDSGRAPEIHVPFERDGALRFNSGRLGFATAGAGISGVVFFVTASPITVLDRAHPCFGTVVSDREVVWRITEVKTDSRGRPLEPVRIDAIRIFKVGDPPPLPEPVPFTPSRRPLEMIPPPSE